MDVKNRLSQRNLRQLGRHRDNSSRELTYDNGVDSSSGDDFDIDQSILKQVKAAVGRVAEFQKGEPYLSDDENPLPTEKEVDSKRTLSSSELLDIQISEMHDEIARQETEVKQLEEGGVMLGEMGIRKDVLEEMMDDIIHSAASSNASGGGTTFSDKQALLDGLSRRAAISVKEKEGDEASSWMMSHVELNEALSGITMEAANWEVIKNDGTELLREHTHSGNVGGYSFNVTFIAREKPGVCGSTGPSEGGVEEANMFSRTDRIISLRPEVDSRAVADLQAFLTRVSGECDLLGFYQTYLVYCLACKCRRETWRTIQSTLGQSVILPGDLHGNRLSYTSHTRVGLHFTWDIVVPTYGFVVEDKVTVQIKTPIHASSDQLEASSSPHLLQSLVKKHGAGSGLLHMFEKLEPDAPWHNE